MVRTGRLRCADNLESKRVHTCLEFRACVSDLTYISVFNTKPPSQTSCDPCESPSLLLTTASVELKYRTYKLVVSAVGFRAQAEVECKMHVKHDVTLDNESSCASFSDKMGIKTTVHEIVAAKHNLSIPNPVTHDDFLKCK